MPSMDAASSFSSSDITTLHPDIIRSHILNRLDGPTLASASSATLHLRQFGIHHLLHKLAERLCIEFVACELSLELPCVAIGVEYPRAEEDSKWDEPGNDIVHLDGVDSGVSGDDDFFYGNGNGDAEDEISSSLKIPSTKETLPIQEGSAADPNDGIRKMSIPHPTDV
ncbi:F-box protein [Vigna angularis]|uniref:F-box protein n=1 Tax=Phaseolus angularis TaxID=3914 RepID=A0A8T0KDU2_PHAAN|nr:F-box protein [Vigna angularis]